MKELIRIYFNHKTQAFFISSIIFLPIVLLFYQATLILRLEFQDHKEESFVLSMQDFIAPSVQNSPAPTPNIPQIVEPIVEKIESIKPKPIKKVVKKIQKPINKQTKTEFAHQVETTKPTDIQNIEQIPSISSSKTDIAPKNTVQTLTYGKSDNPHLKEIKAAIDKAGFYPRQARRMRMSGEVWVEFLWLKRGILKDLKVSRSSGYELLDLSAMETIKIASKEFPALNEDARLSVPIVYHLK
ncbi:energy transducer TonB [Campylobacter fetus]|uniref:energy transducer TonB n=1 Tax=Campylobacter fetus TaxID=196 RepID=UPI00073AAEBF|nr:energy transducer TonB [Campylobacter fetus]ALV65613.1 energy transduction protein TonB [Campylobacter fetus subsp. testudinum Sp3]